MTVENKETTIGFRATKTERALIEKQASKLKLRLSVYVRLCILNDISGRKP